jgi:hypothetical protein
VPCERALAQALCQARRSGAGEAGAGDLAAALREVRELLDEGLPVKGIEAAIEAVRRRAERPGGEGGTEAT